MRIAIVDDDALVCESLSTIAVQGSLQQGTDLIEVLAVGNNGLEAIEIYEKYQPDILLLDIQMPEMNGLEAAKIILEKYPKAKILFLTTF